MKVAGENPWPRLLMTALHVDLLVYSVTLSHLECLSRKMHSILAEAAKNKLLTHRSIEDTESL